MGQPTHPVGRDRDTRLVILAWAAAAVGVAVIAIAWMQIAWAWSPVDDAGHAVALNALMDEHGVVQGMALYVQQMFNIDLEWGLFRPSYWVYPSVFYLLSPPAAHLVRLAMIIVALTGPILHFRRAGYRGSRLVMVILLLLASASSLYIGLFLVSLQELSALAFIGLGLAFPNRWFRLVMWTVAAWFKAPFSWLLIGQAIADWRRGRRRLAVANLAVGVLTLGLAVIMARQGSYTAKYGFDPFGIWANLQRLIEPMNALLLVAVVWWLAVTQSRVRRSPDTIIFGIGFAGYTAQMLPWGVTAYYMGPISFLLGLTLASLLGKVRDQRAIVPLVALIVPALVAVILTTIPLLQGFRINGAMAGLQQCLQSRPGTSSVLQGNVIYVTTSEEAPIRLVQGLQLADPAWTGSVTLGGLAGDGRLPEGVDLLLTVGDRLPATPAGLTMVCDSWMAQAYETGGA